MPEGWEWDETLFLGSARYYRRGRLPYAPGLADVLARELGLDGRGRLLDVGCGPGTVALGLADLFADVVGVDPDGAMLTEARCQSVAADVSDRTRWIQARAEELPLDLGTFTVVTFGQSFHWMDRDKVAATVRAMLAPGGAFLQIADLKNERRTARGLPYPAVPYDGVDALVREHLGPERRAGQGVLRHGTPGDETAVLARAGFVGPRRLVVPGGEALKRTGDDVAAWVFSLSSSAPHLFGDRRDAFAADLDRLLENASPSGRFSERQPSTEVLVWRKPPHP
ncbi:class I SAM-dependent methyltransferase [Streptomyces sp. CBMA29]|uniref:class I SAM-dependent methyltransferase n=1 Tax=Streptomyces sp. CBMA29 TaxID=1896314 RepID=UPI0016620E0F|nr:class I SAM-dependent methyltransferase [Streptomyces sp. CBMA29]MBD0737425.1 methyltransferase [Streptomyces sp. CBMA29]